MRNLVRVLIGLLILGAVLLSGLVGFVVVAAQAEGEHVFDVMGDAILAALAWWGAAALVAVAGVSSLRPGRHRVPVAVAAGLAVGVAAAGTLWLIRPQAADGRDRPETAAAGQEQVAALVRQVAGEDGTPLPASPDRCLDRFGRTEGATRREAAVRVVGGLDQARRDAAATTLRAEGWSVGPVRGTRTEGLSAERDGYRVDVETRHGDQYAATWTVVTATSPCLRA